MEKCHFLQPSVCFLGHQISAECISTDPDKVAAVKQWQVPPQSEIGILQLLQEVLQGFSQLAGPLHEEVNACIRENSPIRSKSLFDSLWTPACQESLNPLKDRFNSAPLLGYADFSLPFVIKTDARG